MLRYKLKSYILASNASLKMLFKKTQVKNDLSPPLRNRVNTVADNINTLANYLLHHSGRQNTRQIELMPKHYFLQMDLCKFTQIKYDYITLILV